MVNKKIKNKTLFGTIGALLCIFGMLATIPILMNRSYVLLGITAVSVIIGVLLIAWTLS